ncbi:hypothetical protein [Bacillus dakarensis]|uniref:hypothetical protein n=1 Tax=Robertmurraya dakarensis TaxID=1926278 RepID=UPI000981B74E|nr:hypothetical protein [Bacillus dakarensis]
MEWALTILFCIAAGLLIWSTIKAKQDQRAKQREMDTSYVALMEEITKLQKHVRSVELDGEITAQVAGISGEERALLRNLLDLYKRGYTVEGIAANLEISENEVKRLIAPYMSSKGERRKVANDR